jgi:hypothetical protein
MAQDFVFRQVGRPFEDLDMHLTNSEKIKTLEITGPWAQYWKREK